MTIRGKSLNDFGLSATQAVGASLARLNAAIRHAIAWRDGTGADSINAAATRSLAMTGAAVAVDLDADFADLAGAAIPFTGLKDVMLHAPESNAADVTVNFGVANGWTAGFTGTIVLKPNTSARLLTGNAAAYAVTAGTGDQVSATGTTGDVLEIGVGGIAP